MATYDMTMGLGYRGRKRGSATDIWRTERVRWRKRTETETMNKTLIVIVDTKTRQTAPQNARKRE